MIKKINIKLIICIVVLISLSLLYYSLYKDFIHLPSDNWSKEVTLDSYSIDNEGLEYYSNKSFASTIYNDAIYTVAIDKNSDLLIHTYDLKGNLIHSSSIPNIVELKPENMSLWSNNHLFYLFVESDNHIELITFNDSFSDIVDTFEINETFQSYKQHDNHLLLLQNEKDLYLKVIYYNLVDKKMVTSKTQYLTSYDFIIKEDSIIIYGTDLMNSQINFTQRTLSLNQPEEILTPKQLNDEPLLIMNGTKPLEVISYFDEPDKEIDVMFLLYSSRFGDTYNHLKTFDYDSLEENYSTKFNTSNKYPNISFLSLNLNKIDLITNTMTFVNKSEVGSRSEKYSNLILYTMGENEDERDIKQLTKTKSSNPFYEFYPSNDSYQYDYLVFNSYKNGNEVLYLASNDTDIIAKSQKINFDDGLGIFLGLLITLPPLCIMIFLQLLITCVPLAIIFIPIVFIAYDWTERNPEKITLAIIIAYLIAKLYYVYAHLNVQMIYKTLQGYVPFYLKSPISIALLIIAELVVSYVCMLSYREKHPKSSFIKPVLIFVLTDLILFSLLFTVYTII